LPHSISAVSLAAAVWAGYRLSCWVTAENVLGDDFAAVRAINDFMFQLTFHLLTSRQYTAFKEKRELVVGEIAILAENTPPRPLLWTFSAPRPFLPSFMLGFVTDIANTLFSFAEDFAAIVVFSSDKFKAYLD
jgi:hypothetical protein